LVCFATVAAPMTAATYAGSVLAYRFVNGITMAAFAGMILEMVKGGAAVATKYTLFVAVSNQAISYVTYLDSLASTFHGTGAVGPVLFDGLFTLFGVAIVAAMTLFLRRPQPIAATGSGAPPFRADR